MINKEEIKPDMLVLGSDGEQFAVVDHLGETGNTVKLKKDSDGNHHYVPIDWVVSATEGNLHINRPAAAAQQTWQATP